MASTSLSVVHLTVLAAACLAATCCATFSYTCFANSTIIGHNPDPDLYTYSEANNSLGDCTATCGGDTNITITGCEKETDILLILSNRSDWIGGKHSATLTTIYRLRCNNINESGIVKQVDVGFTPSIAPEIQANVTPIIQVSTAIRENYTFETTEEETTALLGTKLYWTIDLPSKYVGIPQRCEALSGANVATGTRKANLTFDGCSADDSLVQDFTFTNNSDYYRLYAEFYVFKFYDSDYITLNCTLLLCMAADTSRCDIDCGGRRRRRSLDEVEAVDSAVEAGQVEVGTSTTLRVVEKVTVESGTTSTGPKTVVTVLGILVVMVAGLFDGWNIFQLV